VGNENREPDENDDNSGHLAAKALLSSTSISSALAAAEPIPLDVMLWIQQLMPDKLGYTPETMNLIRWMNSAHVITWSTSGPQ
jgi:hypothetical protein